MHPCLGSFAKMEAFAFAFAPGPGNIVHLCLGCSFLVRNTACIRICRVTCRDSKELQTRVASLAAPT